MAVAKAKGTRAARYPAKRTSGDTPRALNSGLLMSRSLLPVAAGSVRVVSNSCQKLVQPSTFVRKEVGIHRARGFSGPTARSQVAMSDGTGGLPFSTLSSFAHACPPLSPPEVVVPLWLAM